MKGHLIQGTQNIFFAQLGDPHVTQYFSGISRYMSGRFITMMFWFVWSSICDISYS
ncbi:PTS system glucose-specific transporter subunit IIBC [Staphylococcus gallinarum]|uniref:PTS system glucose-specific transporter subunit IIBC n=1 Tax=Staphylococcus gallinarum TaxID=1293 RepID=A0A380FNX5_STAGA|nr:PTS system glucose-specific transporter subunit IIBC [Staphylococcus gallinarum]